MAIERIRFGFMSPEAGSHLEVAVPAAAVQRAHGTHPRVYDQACRAMYLANVGLMRPRTDNIFGRHDESLQKNGGRLVINASAVGKLPEAEREAALGHVNTLLALLVHNPPAPLDDPRLHLRFTPAGQRYMNVAARLRPPAGVPDVRLSRMVTRRMIETSARLGIEDTYAVGSDIADTYMRLQASPEAALVTSAAPRAKQPGGQVLLSPDGARPRFSHTESFILLSGLVQLVNTR